MKSKMSLAINTGELSLPQKRYYRQRAHSNPIADHTIDYPVTPQDFDWSTLYPNLEQFPRGVEVLDIGCGYGGLLIELSPLLPDKLILGLEIRVKVSDYVKERIKALRSQNEAHYSNISCLRSNAMKHLPNYFRKGQLTGMFFLFPDPHFKKHKHKWRIISPQLLSEYAFLLAVGGRVYIATDVEELYEWMHRHLSEHPLFQAIPKESVDADPIAARFEFTEEGKKVRRNNGQIWKSIFERIEDPYTLQNSS